MTLLQTIPIPTRYDDITVEKASGATYTPSELADFVAAEMIKEWDGGNKEPLKILDPAVGEGELLLSLLDHLPKNRKIEVYGFDNNQEALDIAISRLETAYPNADVRLEHGDFLSIACSNTRLGDLFEPQANQASTFDLIIANPPYVRTQIMGAEAAQALASQFGLTGRVDLYHAFILAIAKVLRPNGVSGIIVSNRFMTTKAGASVRRIVQEQLHLRHVWDLGDSKIFNAAVLPAVLIAEGLNGSPRTSPTFTSMYETKEKANLEAPTITSALAEHGIVQIPDGRRFQVQRGALSTSGHSEGVWRVATKENDAWLATVKKNTWGTFRQIGKVRVGVKTCADKVFIKKDWDSTPKADQPELLRPLTTHHIGRRFRADPAGKWRDIVYPHEIVKGKRQAIDLAKHPRTLEYLEEHREKLESRSYLMEAGRNWYELWVPQDPGAWAQPKLVFRDISEHPCFWIDLDETIVNGDCYWLVCDDPSKQDLLWLALSVGNSSFIEVFYDHSFNNKLYAGRRRFITQYVEKFPLPDPHSPIAVSIIEKAKRLYECVGETNCESLESELNKLVWESFGLPFEEIGG
jgi:adenine-specific DNA-methyltransferase